MSRMPCGTPSAQRLLSCPCARPAQPSPAAGPEGSFSANHVRGFPTRSADLHFSASAKGPPMACQPANHPETLRGQRYSMPCPTAKNWAPFVCGCAPEDAGANHDMRRVRLLDEQPVLATTRPANQPTGGSVLPSRRPLGLRRLSPADQNPGGIICR